MRTRIALRNLYISQTIIVLFLIYAWFVWYPHSFSQLGGFKRTAFMLILVDLVLGPLLVLIVYDEGKKHLRFDINVLLAIQLAAFVYGGWALYLKHPAYAVFSGDRFVLTNASALYPRQTLWQHLRGSFFSSPRMVVAEMPSDAAERNSLLFEALFERAPGLERRIAYYTPLVGKEQAIFAKSLNPNKLFWGEERKARLRRFITEQGGDVDDYVYYPLTGNNQHPVVWALDRQTARPAGIIDVDPWLSQPGKPG